MTCQSLKIRLLSPYVAFLMTAGLYFFSAAPDITPSANGGELTSAASTLGIGHPTGYPTWTILAHIASVYIPVGDIAFRANLFTAFATAICVLVTYLILATFFLKTSFIFPFLAIFAIEPFFWREALCAEVYSFHLMFTSMLIWALIKGFSNSDKRFFLLASFLWALSITNHLLSIFNFPLLILIWDYYRQKKIPVFRDLMVYTFYILLGLSIYSFIPIRASLNPSLIWHNPSTFGEFFKHISGSQFQSHLGFKLSFSISEIIDFILTPRYFLLLLFATAGIIKWLKKYRKLSVGPGLFLIGIFMFPLFYSIHDVSSYFLSGIWVMYCSMAYFISSITALEKHISKFGIPYACLVFCLGIYFFNDEIKLYHKPLLRLYGQTCLAALPPGSELEYQGDNPMNSLSYLMICEHYLENAVCIDLNSNLKPLGNKRPESGNRQNFTVRSFRKTYEYKLYTPNCNIFIPRNINKHSDAIYHWLSDSTTLNFAEVSKWNPNYNELMAQIELNMGEYSFEFGRWEDAILHLNNAVNRPISTALKRYVASVFATHGELYSAIELIEKSILINGKDSDSLNNLAYYRYLSGQDLMIAIDNAEAGLLLEPDNPSIVDTLYRLYLATGKLDNAKELESICKTSIPAELTVQRKLLWNLRQSLPGNALSLKNTKEIDAVINSLPLPALNQNYRLLLTRKLMLGNYTDDDINKLSRLCISMGIPNAALAAINTLDPDIYSDPTVLNKLNIKCFNFCRL